MKQIVIAAMMLVSGAAYSFWSQSFLTIRSDKPIYSIGETAVLRASLATRPEDPELEIELMGTLNGNPLTIHRATDFEHFSLAEGLEAGEHSWEVEAVLQSKSYARDLKNAIAHFSGRIQEIEEELAETTDPSRIEELEEEKAVNETLREAAESELSQHRSRIAGPQSVNFIVQ